MSPDCLEEAFQHFLSYTGYGECSPSVIEKLRIAYEHGSSLQYEDYRKGQTDD